MTIRYERKLTCLGCPRSESEGYYNSIGDYSIGYYRHTKSTAEQATMHTTAQHVDNEEIKRFGKQKNVKVFQNVFFLR